MTDEQAKKLGALIVQARSRQHISTRRLAQMAGVPQPWLVRVEQGLFNDPAPERLTRVAEALGIDPARIDRVTHNHLANSLPSLHTYFRSKEKASPEEIADIEAAIKRVRKKHRREE
jgi:transcriptional regulator with XRE-family HTH domain